MQKKLTRFSENESVTIIYGLLLLASIVVYCRGSIAAFQHPFNVSLYDAVWAAAFFSLSLVFGLLLGFWRGRLLIRLSLILPAVFILLTLWTGKTGLALAVLFWLTMLSHALGHRVLNWLAGDADFQGSERIAFTIPVGYGLLSLLTFGLAALHVLSLPIVLAVLIVATILLGRQFVSDFKACVNIRPVRMLEGLVKDSDLRLAAFVVACCAVSFLSAYVWAVAPATDYDSLNYHLSVPQIYAQNHGFVNLPYTFWSYFAGSTETLYALALTSVGQPLPQFIHLAFGVLLGFMAFFFGRRFGGIQVGFFSAVLISTVPMITWDAGTSCIDLSVSLFSFAAAYAVVVWTQNKKDRWILIAALMAGFGVSAKLNAILVVIPVTVLFLFHLLRSRDSWTHRTKVGLVFFALPALLVSAPWFVLRWIWTGNPIFPFLNAIFRSPQWSSSNTLFNWADFGRGHDLKAFLLLPWNLTANTHSFAEAAPTGIAGVLPLLGVPFFLLFMDQINRRFIYRILFLVLGTALLWFKVGQYGRYLLPLMPLLAFLGALNIETVYRLIRQRGRLIQVFQGIGLVLGLLYLLSTGLVGTVWHWNIPERYPYRVALGLESRERFLSRSVPVYKALNFLDRHAHHAKVLSIGNEFHLYTSAQIEGEAGSPVTGQLAVARADSSLAQRIADSGYKYLLINWTQIDALGYRKSLPLLDSKFLSQYGKLVFSSRNVSVYKWLSSGAPSAESISPNFLGNPGFEEISAQGIPKDWVAYGKPLVDRSGKHSHTGQVAVLVRYADGFYNRVRIEPGQMYSLGYWARADRPNQLARLQVNWLGADSQIVDVEIEFVPIGSEWNWHKFNVSAPEFATDAIVYASVEKDSEVWMDDFVFKRE